MGSENFNFITPKSFRQNIVESVNFVAKLWIIGEEIEARYQDEVARTIILYNTSIVEALLLFRAKKKRLKFFKTEYKTPTLLATVFQNKDSNVVLAFQFKTPKGESEIWLNDLIKEQKDFLGKLYDTVRDLQIMRNTIHLSIERNGVDFSTVEKSYDIVVKLAEKIKNDLT